MNWRRMYWFGVNGHPHAEKLLVWYTRIGPVWPTR